MSVPIIKYLLNSKAADKDVIYNLNSSEAYSANIHASFADTPFRSSSNRRAGFGKLLVFRFSFPDGVGRRRGRRPNPKFQSRFSILVFLPEARESRKGAAAEQGLSKGPAHTRTHARPPARRRARVGSLHTGLQPPPDGCRRARAHRALWSSTKTVSTENTPQRK